MKSTKDAVYEFVRQSVYSGPEYANGVETKEIAAALGKQRSNISTALNELIKEGKLIKSDGRPVLYKLTETIKENNYPEFGLLVGHDGSLKSAVQLAKAAILYPKRSLNILISSKGGCGTTYFATGMHGYALAKGVLKENAPFVKINCRHYTNNTAILDEDLFGKDGKDTSAFERARGGMLFIDCFDLLNVRQQNRIFAFLDTGCLVAMSATVNYDVQIQNDIKNGFLGGEGIFIATLTGPGEVWMQSLPFNRMADAIIKASKYSAGESPSFNNPINEVGSSIENALGGLFKF